MTNTNQNPDQTLKPSTVAKAWESSFASVPDRLHERLEAKLNILDLLDELNGSPNFRAVSMRAPLRLNTLEDSQAAARS